LNRRARAFSAVFPAIHFLPRADKTARIIPQHAELPVHPGSPCLQCGAVPYRPSRDLGVRFLLPTVPHPSSSGTASHHSAYYQRAGSAQAGCKQRIVRYGFAMVSLWFRYGFRGFYCLPASPVPLCLTHSLHHSPPYYSDAAAPKKVTALLRSNFPLWPAAAGLRSNSGSSRRGRYCPATRPA